VNKFFGKVKGYLDPIQYRIHPLAREIDPRIPKRWVLSRSMVSNNGHYCYFRIPKCANSTIVRSLAAYDPAIIFDPTDFKGRNIKRQTSNLFSARALTVFSLTQKYFLFTFVRNPYARVLSAYLDKIAILEKQKFDAKRQVVMTFSDSGRDLTFKAFVRYLENGGLYQDPHWAPQTAMLPFGVKLLHFVGRVENLDKDLETIVNRLFGKGVYKGPTTREAGRTNSTDKLTQFYDKILADRVYALYQADFESFSYPKDISS
jgi:hypothetical protein